MNVKFKKANFIIPYFTEEGMKAQDGYWGTMPLFDLFEKDCTLDEALEVVKSTFPRLKFSFTGKHDVSSRPSMIFFCEGDLKAVEIDQFDSYEIEEDV